jgi:putative acetyltransferase
MDQFWQGFRIRDWQGGDRHAAAAVVQQVLEEYGVGWEPERADREMFEIEIHYWQRQGEFWVVEWAGNIIATAGYHPIERGHHAVEIRKVYILEAFRGKGLGRYLMSQLEQAIATKGYQEIWVETITRFAAAKHIYETSGYQPAEGIETERCDLVYCKPLSS